LLREAAINLLYNAIRFAPDRGRVSLSLVRGSDHAVFTVTDNGPGIPPDQLPRLGERFFRARNTASAGSGLGLAIARAVVERHGGKLVMDNLPGGSGCCGTLIVPCSSKLTAD
jgi:signal transduction histidine kinase